MSRLKRAGTLDHQKELNFDLLSKVAHRVSGADLDIPLYEILVRLSLCAFRLGVAVRLRFSIWMCRTGKHNFHTRNEIRNLVEHTTTRPSSQRTAAFWLLFPSTHAFVEQLCLEDGRHWCCC